MEKKQSIIFWDIDSVVFVGLLVCFLFQQQNLQTHVNKYDPDGSPHFFFSFWFSVLSTWIYLFILCWLKTKAVQNISIPDSFLSPWGKSQRLMRLLNMHTYQTKNIPKAAACFWFYIHSLHLSLHKDAEHSTHLHDHTVTAVGLYLCCQCRSKPPGQWGRPSPPCFPHGGSPSSPSANVACPVRKYPVTKAQAFTFIFHALYCSRWEHIPLGIRVTIPKENQLTHKTHTNQPKLILMLAEFPLNFARTFFFSHGCFNINMPWVGQGYSSVNHESQDSWLDICRFVHQQE